MEITFHEVTVDSEDLQSTIESLEAANARNLRIKALYEEILRVQGGGARSSSISPWRTGLGVRVARARNAKTLAETITDVLLEASEPLRPKDLRDRVLEAGYITQARDDSFYIAVFNTAKKVPGIIKSKAGFSLNKPSGGSASKDRRK